MKIRDDNKIPCIKEEGDASFTNQAHDKHVSKIINTNDKECMPISCGSTEFTEAVIG